MFLDKLCYIHHVWHWHGNSLHSEHRSEHQEWFGYSPVQSCSIPQPLETPIADGIIIIIIPLFLVGDVYVYGGELP